jgi:solute carrier family 45, member 1/2/4
MLLVPNGEDIGYALGDYNPYEKVLNSTKGQTPLLPHRTSADKYNMKYVVSNSTVIQTDDEQPPNSHPWGVFFTILGTVLLDFDADACQSPSRAYLLDVTLPGIVLKHSYKNIAFEYF